MGLEREHTAHRSRRRAGRVAAAQVTMLYDSSGDTQRNPEPGVYRPAVEEREGKIQRAIDWLAIQSPLSFVIVGRPDDQGAQDLIEVIKTNTLTSSGSKSSWPRRSGPKARAKRSGHVP